MVSAESVLHNLNERLWIDEETKDIQIEMADGLLRAHSTVLIATSDAIRGMLRHGRAAAGGNREKRLAWKEHFTDVGRFFLRLLYTGTVEETEWSTQDDVLHAKEPPQTLRIRSPNGARECEGLYELVQTLRPNRWPLWQRQSCDEKPERYLYCSGMAWGICGRQTRAKNFQASVGFIVSEHRWSDTEGLPLPHEVYSWTRWRPGEGQKVDEDISVLEPTRRVPLRLLLGSLDLAKMYLFHHLLEVLVPALEARLSPETFDCICSAAIRTDTAPLRLGCVAYARRRADFIGELKTEGKLSPEVLAEIAGALGLETPAAKRRKL